MSDETEAAGSRQRARSLTTLVVSGAILLALLAAAFLLPVPFVKVSPGPTFNVIGDVSGEPVILISGTETFPTTGQLDMTTVMESGGPRGGLTFVDAIASWFNASDAVLPQELLYPDDQTGAEVRQRQAEMFSTAEADATAAALQYLGLPVTREVVITSVVEGSPAEGQLRARDTIVAVDGNAVQGPDDVVSAIRGKPAGTEFAITVNRLVDDVPTDVDVKVTSADNPSNPGTPYVGVSVGNLTAGEFPVDFTLQDIGGPSAGLMLSLGIVDKLTPEDLAQGRHIAGTGTITADGVVGPIGGIRQKLAGARGAGAELFLMPKSHCAEAEGHIPDGLTVVPVEKLADAVAAIKAWTSGGAVDACAPSVS